MEYTYSIKFNECKMKRKVKRELIEWILILSIAGIIYVGGWHTEVIGKIQQAVLATGIISPDYAKDEKTASYNFWFEDMSGKQISFTEYQGKVVFINFWATWCPPCIAEMPDINSLYSETKDQIQFVMISLDQDERKAREFIQRKNFKFPVYFLRSTLPPVYDTHSIPTTYVLDTNGVVKVENHGMAKYNTEEFKAFLLELSTNNGSSGDAFDI